VNCPRNLPRHLALAALLLAGTLHAAPRTAPAAAPLPSPAGERIYRDGALPSGEPLRAEREAGVTLTGRDAACANCHRRSGLGAMEGRSAIPPVTGRYLFAPKARAGEDRAAPQFVEGMRADREPFTRATLARAIRAGVGADGRPLSYLMPHFALDEAAMGTLIDYLGALGQAPVPGVTDSLLHFASIITPDADPVKKRAMLAVLQAYVADKNANARAVAPPLRSDRRMMFRVVRRWELHVWELTGAPDTWEAQLQARLKREPVFAVISGLGGRTWAPVHRFCERAALPCLFPNVDAPAAADGDFYTMYFSRGVLLEADLAVKALAGNATPPRRVLQVFRADDVGADAARALAAGLHGGPVAAVSLPLAAGATPAKELTRELAKAVAAAGDDDAVLLWLRPEELRALPANPPKGARVWLSGVMGGLDEAPLPDAWRAGARMTYPVDLPLARRVRVDYPLGWFRIRKIPVEAVKVQVDTWLALGLLSETLKRMVDTFVQDYLLERVEGMLEHRVLTGYYPRLALAPGQRFASKGGYTVHFAGPKGREVVADGGWVVP
jgi:hypothetical protein